MISAYEIKEAIAGNICKGKANTLFCGISTDSRRISKGQLFWALKGERFDGHDFVIDAINSGALGIVVEDSYLERILERLNSKDIVVISVRDTLKGLGDLAKWWRSRYDVKVIAVTGSTGKTSTKEMIYSILSINKKVLKNPGNYNNLIGLPLTLLNLDSSYDIAVLEMGMNMPGEIGRLTEIANPDIGIITNIGPVHLEGVGDIHGVARAKAELVERISPKGTVFINGDNSLLLNVISSFRRKIIRFGQEPHNHVVLENISLYGLLGSSFRISWEGEKIDIRLNLPGISNIMNATVAAAVCLYLGESKENIKNALASYRGIKGRFEIIHLMDGIILIDDTYNSNPLSLRASLDSLKRIKGEREVIIGLGDMLELGTYSEHAHREAGKMVANLKPKFFVAIGSFAKDMIDGAIEAGMDRSRLFISSDHEEMAYELEKRVHKDIMIFLKASRRIALEKVVEHIMKRFGKADPNAL